MIKYFLSSFFLILLIYSGLFKWIPLPLDITIIAAIPLALVCPILILRKNIIKNIKLKDIYILFAFICVSISFSCIITISKSYWETKLMGVILSFFCFGCPILLRNYLFHNTYHILNSLNYLGIILIIYTFIQWYVNGLNMMINERYATEDRMPVYLALSDFMGILILTNMRKTNTYRLIILIGATACLFLLGGRGPVLGVILCIIIYGVLSRDILKTNYIKYIFAICSIVIIGYLTNLYLSGRLISRFEALIYESSFDIDYRMNLWMGAIDIAINYPIFGIGFGSYGLVLNDIDGRGYPHNIFLEIAAEMGILTSIVTLILFISIFKRIIKMKKIDYGAILFIVCTYSLIQFQKSGALEDSRTLFGWFGIALAYYLKIVTDNQFLRKTRLNS